MHLFLCYTTLQLVIAGRIITKLKLNRSCIEVLYISKVDNIASRNAIAELKEIVSTVHFIHMKYKYPIYFPKLYGLFSGRFFDSVYVASVDNILMHYILSRVEFQDIYTFDDGTANIFPGSIYYQKSTDNVSSCVIRLLLNIRFSMERIKLDSVCHYTIYEGYENIITRLVPITLFPEKIINPPVEMSYQECNVFLGGIMTDVFKSNTDLSFYIDKCERLLNDSGVDVIFIPHPRGREEHFLRNENWIVLKPAHIAEMEIINLLDKYKTINLYGFLSSCQLNLQATGRIKNYVFYSKNQSETFKNAIQKSPFLNYFNVEIIDLDDQKI